MRTRVIYTTFEQAVIALYNKGTLTLDLLDTLALVYRGMEVDSAGSYNLRASDGKDLQQACIALVNPAFTLIEQGHQRDDDEYWEIELQEWSHITNARWGWC
ncbi:MAG: hypothetical protein ACYDER_02285 [Ktedonobacteraceae bacterium]